MITRQFFADRQTTRHNKNYASKRQLVRLKAQLSFQKQNIILLRRKNQQILREQKLQINKQVRYQSKQWSIKLKQKYKQLRSTRSFQLQKLKKSNVQNSFIQRNNNHLVREGVLELKRKNSYLIKTISSRNSFRIQARKQSQLAIKRDSRHRVLQEKSTTRQKIREFWESKTRRVDEVQEAKLNYIKDSIRENRNQIKMWKSMQIKYKQMLRNSKAKFKR